jgi:hypothetical protein
VEVASGRSAETVGKPQPQLLMTALDRLGEGRTLNGFEPVAVTETLAELLLA